MQLNLSIFSLIFRSNVWNILLILLFLLPLILPVEIDCQNSFITEKISINRFRVKLRLIEHWGQTLRSLWHAETESSMKHQSKEQMYALGKLIMPSYFNVYLCSWYYPQNGDTALYRY